MLKQLVHLLFSKLSFFYSVAIHFPYCLSLTAGFRWGITISICAIKKNTVLATGELQMGDS